MRVSFALISCLFASTISPLFTGCGDDGEDPDPGPETGGEAGSSQNTGGRVTTGGRGGGTGGGGGVSDGGEAGEGGTGTGIGTGGSGGKNPCSPNPCKNGANCVRQGDVALCACPTGYKGELCDIDIDECLADNGGCGASECVNTPGSFKCGDCDEGYVKDETGDCVDIDECEVLTQACDPRTDCTNTAGGYTCSICPAGLTGDPKDACIDLNECLNDPCDELSNCTNVFGEYFCSACPAGYTGDGATCSDINECMYKSGGCEVPLRDCINTVGSWKCGDCVEGYEENGATQCDDIDECEEDLDDCDSGFECENIPGSYECEDIDECEEETDECLVGYECENTEGYYDCNDIDECEEELDNCEEGYECVDTDGSYECNDIDECEAQTDTCTEEEECENTDGGFNCNDPSCEPGDCGGSAICVDGVCEDCVAPTSISCSNTCVNHNTSNEHCGFCDNPCEPPQTECNSGNCLPPP
jgi:hypothetical protein